MEVVYEVAGPCTVKRIWRHRHIDRKYTTVMTTMVRLARKGLLLRRRDGQAYVYIATCTEAEFVELQIAAIKRGIGE
jgi:predicted transcriptional regulator